ncbi:hypothetical protein PENTCL1PPCAC_15727 [Pristionchus entomophagus]|uniref:G protein-coupled receptor n=1 Tax=Pristionchus entomophagus TaxID=358040 RepID=A0AAV5TGT3_9BILA|nr:hypothetical protein PENTCL1PPCAC_15727 [Pristionchus entomophagus]
MRCLAIPRAPNMDGPGDVLHCGRIYSAIYPADANQFYASHALLRSDSSGNKSPLQYESYVHIALVIFLPVTSFCLYTLLLIGLLHEHGNILKARSSNTLSRATLQIIIQSGLVICTHLSACLRARKSPSLPQYCMISVFQTLQFLPSNSVDWMLYVAHFVWMLTHGLKPIVYLSVNQTIREKLLSRVKPRRVRVTIFRSVASRYTSDHAIGNVDWYKRGVRRPLLGCLCIAFSAVAAPFYVALAHTISSMRHLSVYKVFSTLHECLKSCKIYVKNGK